MARFMNEKLSPYEPATLYSQTDTEALSSDPSYGLHNYTPVLWNDNINYSITVSYRNNQYIRLSWFQTVL